MSVNRDQFPNLVDIVNNSTYKAIRDLKKYQDTEREAAKKAVAESGSGPAPEQKRTLAQINADIMTLIAYVISLKNDQKIVLI